MKKEDETTKRVCAVSYTHLDVYKRQCKHILLPNIFEKTLWKKHYGKKKKAGILNF